jgi:histone-binding protein RBBP4
MQDVAWHNHHQHIFGSVGDDKQLIVWDSRQQSACFLAALPLQRSCAGSHPCAR